MRKFVPNAGAAFDQNFRVLNKFAVQYVSYYHGVVDKPVNKMYGRQPAFIYKVNSVSVSIVNLYCMMLDDRALS